MLERVRVRDLRLPPLAHGAVLQSREDHVVPEVDLGVLVGFVPLRRVLGIASAVVALVVFIEGLLGKVSYRNFVSYNNSFQTIVPMDISSSL